MMAIAEPAHARAWWSRLFKLVVVCLGLVNLCGVWMGGAGHHSLYRQLALALALLLLGLVALVWQAGRTTRALQRLLLHTGPLPPVVQALSATMPLHGRVVVLHCPAPLAFCFGFCRPRIALSTGLLALLSPAELAAVLWHEEHHRRNFDPLQRLLLQTLSTTFFFLPVVREWGALYEVQMELRADRYASAHAGKVALAAALYRLATCRAPGPGLGGAALVGLSATRVRIHHLLHAPVPLPAVSPRSWLLSSLVLWGLCWLLMA